MKITLCGSMNFVEDIKSAIRELTEMGHEVFHPEPLVSEESYAEEHSREKLLLDKADFTRGHFKRIEDSEGVLIINKEKKGIKGYIGSNTLMELTVAFYLGKQIFFLHPFGEDHPHYEELYGLDAEILEGDLTKIKVPKK
jgi:hypothetical protein